MDPIRQIIEWFRQKARHQQRAAAHDPAEVQLWCQRHFEREQALAHYLRIEQRLGRYPVRLSQKFRMSAEPLRKRRLWWFRWLG